MSVECLDLKALFGEKYRVRRDVSSYKAEYGETAHRPDPWLWIIPCRHGEIYPHGGSTLAAGTTRRGKYAKRLAELPCCRLWQDGDDGLTVPFDVADFEAVAAIIKPKRRIRWSAERKAREEAAGRLFKAARPLLSMVPEV